MDATQRYWLLLVSLNATDCSAATTAYNGALNILLSATTAALVRLSATDCSAAATAAADDCSLDILLSASAAALVSLRTTDRSAATAAYNGALDILSAAPPPPWLA